MPIISKYNHGQFNWVDLCAHEMSGAQTFYERVFGWTTDPQDTQGGPPYAIFSKDGQQVAGLGEMTDEMKSQDIPAMWNSYINVDDIEVATKRAIELGGAITVPVMKVLDAGSLAFIQDPTGGNIGLWQADQHIGSQVGGEHGSPCWCELATPDQEQAKEFYGQLFQWEFTPNEHAPTPYDIILCEKEQIGGIMQMNEQWAGVPPHWMPYFAVDDANAVAAAVKEAGGNVCVPPFDIPAGRIAVLDDPQHAVFSVIALSEQQD